MGKRQHPTGREYCLKPFLHYRDDQVMLLHGDALEVARNMGDGAVDCIVSSPPYYGLRDYGAEGQYGLESSPAEYVERMRWLFSELRRVLADDGTLWLNLGDSYSGHHGNRRVPDDEAPSNKPGYWENMRGSLPGGVPAKNLLGIPWRVAFALQDDGWILRNAIIWHKPNAMPESVTDRLSGRYEHVFLFSKQRSYWFDLNPIRESRADSSLARSHLIRKIATKEAASTALGHAGNRTEKPFAPDYGRNPGDVWNIATTPFRAAHFAVMPVELAQRCIGAGCRPGGTVLDPFSGSGTTGLAALRLGRKYVGVDLNAEYLDLSLRTRLGQSAFDFGEVTDG